MPNDGHGKSKLAEYPQRSSPSTTTHMGSRTGASHTAAARAARRSNAVARRQGSNTHQTTPEDVPKKPRPKPTSRFPSPQPAPSTIEATNSQEARATVDIQHNSRVHGSGDRDGYDGDYDTYSGGERNGGFDGDSDGGFEGGRDGGSNGSSNNGLSGGFDRGFDRGFDGGYNNGFTGSPSGDFNDNTDDGSNNGLGDGFGGGSNGGSDGGPVELDEYESEPEQGR